MYFENVVIKNDIFFFRILWLTESSKEQILFKIEFVYNNANTFFYSGQFV